MSKAKLAAFAAALVMAVASNASAQSAQAQLNAPPHMTRARLIVWCKNHPTATADCKEVRGDTKEIRSDRKEVRADRREVRKDIKAGDKQEAKRNAKDLRADRKDLRQDRKDRRHDVRDGRLQRSRRSLLLGGEPDQKPRTQASKDLDRDRQNAPMISGRFFCHNCKGRLPASGSQRLSAGSLQLIFSFYLAD